MKKQPISKNKLYTLAALLVVIALLAFLQANSSSYSYQISILERSAIYAVVAVSMNLLTGFTGLFSLGQAGFMAIGAYTVAILTIPVESRASVYRHCKSSLSFLASSHHCRPDFRRRCRSDRNPGTAVKE